MMLKKILLPLLIAGGLAYAQERKITLVHPDSLISTELEEITVTADREASHDKIIDARTLSIFHNDKDKHLTIRPGIVSYIVGNISSEYSIDGIMNELTGMTLDGTRVVGTRTQWQGAKPKFISGLTEPEIFVSGYSSRNASVAGLMNVSIPEGKKYTDASADINPIERRMTISLPRGEIMGLTGEAGLALKHLEVIPVLKNNFPALKLLPTGYETQFFAAAKKSDGGTHYGAKVFGILARQHQSSNEKNYEVDYINQNNTHSFGKLDIYTENEAGRLNLTIAREEEQFSSFYSANQLDARIESWIRNYTVGLEGRLEATRTNAGITGTFFSDINDKQTITEREIRVYGEQELILGGFWLRPDIAMATNFNDAELSCNAAASYFIGSNEIETSIGRYATYIYDSNIKVGNGVWKKKEEKPATGLHIGVTLRNKELEGIISEAEVSGFYKEVNAEYTSQGYSRIVSRGLRMSAKSEVLNSYLAVFISNPKMNGGLVPNITENQAQYLYWLRISEGLTFNAQLEWRTGLIIRNKKTNIYERQQGGVALNLGLTQEIAAGPLAIDVTAAGFNLLEPLGATVPLGKTYDEQGNPKVYNAPWWVDLNIRISYRH